MKESIKSDLSKSTAIAVLHDARTELRNAADSGLELAEKLTGGVFRFVRKLNQRLDERTGDVLDGVERTLVNSRKTREARKEARRDAKAEVKHSKRADKAA